jgi:hypothetical protein
MGQFIALFMFVSLIGYVFGRHPKHHSSQKYTRRMDENIHYSQIIPFADEWKTAFSDTDHNALSPVHFWMKCVGHEIRGYFHIEDLRKRPTHGKEADMPLAPNLKGRFKLYLNKDEISYKVWNAGGYFTVDVSNLSRNVTANIYINDWRHYTVFPMSYCVEAPLVENEVPYYIMNVYTRYFDDPHNMNKMTTNGIANHFLYHRCALHLSQYELNIQREQLPYFLKHPVLAEAARLGHLVFIIKNSAIPPPIRDSGDHRTGSNCYHQQVSQNLGILRRWKENVRIYMWDGDEYMTYAADFTLPQFNALVQSHPVLGFERYMVFCADCPTGEPEQKYLSFTNQHYRKSERLNDPKLLIDPNKAGIFVIYLMTH